MNSMSQILAWKLFEGDILSQEFTATHSATDLAAIIDRVTQAAPVSPPDQELSDALERLRAMAYDRGETWDLSENDQKALRICLLALTPSNSAKVTT